MADITEQQEVAQEISDVISRPIGFGDEFDEVRERGGRTRRRGSTLALSGPGGGGAGLQVEWRFGGLPDQEAPCVKSRNMPLEAEPRTTFTSPKCAELVRVERACPLAPPPNCSVWAC